MQVCGFEALPADLTVLLAAEAARERWGEELVSVDLDAAVAGPPGLPRLSDSISGGTLQSMLEVARAENAGAAADPAALIDDAEAADAVRRVSPIALAPRKGSREDVIAPMLPRRSSTPPSSIAPRRSARRSTAAPPSPSATARGLRSRAAARRCRCAGARRGRSRRRSWGCAR